MRKMMVMAAVAIGLMLASAARAEDEKKAEEKPAAPTEVIDVKDFAKIKEQEGQTVSVRGKVIQVFTPQSGTRKLFNFEGIGRRDFNVMIAKENFDAVNEGFNGDVEAAVKDKVIVVTGRVALYRDNPQIEVKTWDQIKIEGGKEKPAEEKPKEEKPEEKKPE